MEDERLNRVKEQIESLPKDFYNKLKLYDFNEELFYELLYNYLTGKLRKEDNMIRGEIEKPNEEDFISLDIIKRDKEYREIGLEAISSGKVALIVLAGGMATRFNQEVKALSKLYDNYRFIDIKIKDALNIGGGRIPIWIMTSIKTDQAIRDYINKKGFPVRIELFNQDTLLRIRPDGTLFLDEKGLPSPYAGGHGRLFSAIKKRSFLKEFIERGGRTVLITNVDNIGATIDPYIVGYQIKEGKELIVEVVEKYEGDTGGTPAILNKKLQIIEAIKFPEEFDHRSIPYFNTNTFWVSPQLLLKDYKLKWLVVEKSIKGERVIQFETLLGEVTAYVDSIMLKVERRGLNTRFIPVKTLEDFKRYYPLIKEVIKNRY